MRRHRRGRAGPLAFVALLCFVGCFDPDLSGGNLCGPADSCPAGLRCCQGTCEPECGLEGESESEAEGEGDPGTWTATSGTDAPSERAAHAAVWTGFEMIVWGGSNDCSDGSCSQAGPSGGRFVAATNTWSAISKVGTSGRNFLGLVWADTQMIAWGGLGLSSEVPDLYLPPGDSWSTGTAADVLDNPRNAFTAVWTGDLLIVWGGRIGMSPATATDNGLRYDPILDDWSDVTTTAGAGAPAARANHTAVWTGSEMIVWGGAHGLAFDDGARYDPQVDTWREVSSADAPSARTAHVAVWSDSEMLVWGGSAAIALGDGAKYDPVKDSWAPMSDVEAPPAAAFARAVWSGSEMIVWGGGTGCTMSCTAVIGTGGRYDPAADAWTPLPVIDAPAARRSHTAVWAEDRFVVWGGSTTGDLSTVTGTGAIWQP